MSDGSTGKIVGTILGAVVGYFTGGASLVAFGATIGGAAGSLLDPKVKTEGPRLDDLRVQYSSYGAGIATLYGTERISPNVIWSTKKLEYPTTRDVGGKGGGTENTTYQYFVHMRHLLCETPRDGSIVSIVQIFQDGKMIFDASWGAPVEQALASEENPYSFFTLYQGHSDQLPDPVEEAYEAGPGSVPAYRGVVSISMKAIQCPGGRVPQFAYVLSSGAVVGPKLRNYATITTALQAQRSVITSTGVFQIGSVGNVDTTDLWYGSSGYVQLLGRYAGMAVGYSRGDWVPVQSAGDPEFCRYVATQNDYDQPYQLEALNANTGERFLITQYIPGSFANVISPFRAARDSVSGAFVCTSQTGIYLNAPIIFSDTGKTPLAAIPGFIDVAAHDKKVFVLSNNGSVASVRTLSLIGEILDEVAGPLIGDTARSQIRADANGVYVLLASGVAPYTTRFFKVARTGWTLLAVSDEIPNTNADNDTFFCTDRYAIVGPKNSESNLVRDYEMLQYQSITIANARAKDIISDQCERSGELRFDVSAILDTDTVRGYKIAGPASARANIDPLLTAFDLFIVDEDGLIRYKRRADIASVASITFDELGQAEDGAEPGAAMPLTRTQELDKPRSVTVKYIEPLIDYQIAAELEERQITDANEDVVVDLPLALMSSDHAKQIAQRILFNAYSSQNTRTCKVARKFAFMSPGDGGTYEYPKGTQRLWRVMSQNDTGALLEQTLEPADAALFTFTGIGATGYVGQTVSALEPPTQMLLLDVPIMRDADNNAGLYVGAEGRGPGWRGYTLWIGDDDAGMQERGTVTMPVPLGLAEGALGGWTPNMLDVKNSLFISMGADELFSTTEALLMTTRINLALVGDHGRWEAIQFLTAMDLGTGRFKLSGLLRGLYGTERFRDTHQVNDKFVLITPAAMLRPVQDMGSLGQPKSYRAVSLGRSFDSVASQSFANEGVGLLPYSPWDARKSKAASNDQTLTWERRSRLTTNALRGVVPLGESSESYRVEFYTSSAFTTLAGVLLSPTRSLTITSAQQAAFGLTPGAALYVHISQLSDVVGAGPALEAIL